MKSNGKIVALAVVLAALTIGVGYAAIQNINLVVSGTASATTSDANFKVLFKGNTSVSEEDKVTAGITDDHTASIAVTGLTAKGDKVTATYPIANESKAVAAALSASVTENDNTTYFKVTPTINNATVEADGTTTMTVEVELLKTPVSADQTANIEVTLTAAPQDPAA